MVSWSWLCGRIPALLRRLLELGGADLALLFVPLIPVGLCESAPCFTHACTALALLRPVRALVSVLRCELVAVVADGSFRAPVVPSDHVVHVWEYGFQVVRPHARRVPAEVVDYEPVGYWPHAQHVADPVSQLYELAVDVPTAMSVALPGAPTAPFPAAVGLLNSRPELGLIGWIHANSIPCTT